ncbi:MULTISPECIES: hypothetical protein [unclassified Mesorhizobium]|uniref:hypothetical protein n=3 Tax=Mesorhizobium TaxID=68287 RepID=UPI001672FAE6|nr:MULTISPECIES: hypothetical protein [unclassified Mesorhizobium]
MAISVKTIICTQLPGATKPPSTYPGGGSFQSPKLRTGSDRRTPELSPARGRCPRRYRTNFRKQAIDRRSTDRQQLVAKFAIQIEPAMPLKSRQQNGNRAKAIGRLHNATRASQLRGDKADIVRWAWDRRREVAAPGSHVAIVAGNCDELVQIRRLSARQLDRYRSTIASTNSNLVAANPPRHPASEPG